VREDEKKFVRMGFDLSDGRLKQQMMVRPLHSLEVFDEREAEMELVKCSHCGSDNIEPAPTYGYPVATRCRDCGAEGPPKLTTQEANDAWNHREVISESQV